MSARRTLIAGNWKMNGLRGDGVDLAAAIAGRTREASEVDLLVCPPATLIAPVAEVLRGTSVALGGQDCHPEPSGAFTGDVSAEMLADLGCRYVIVGHSERREHHGEDDALIWQKAVAAHRAGLVPIVCVGETESERDRGEALDVVRRQVSGCIPDAATGANLVVAYEPVWAIGTGRAATVDDVAEVHGAIRAVLRERLPAAADTIRVLYGGSVKPSNAAELLAVEDVDGALVGGASLKADDFLAIAASSN